jgi:hypothetical protein
LAHYTGAVFSAGTACVLATPVLDAAAQPNPNLLMLSCQIALRLAWMGIEKHMRTPLPGTVSTQMLPP